jgi:hypothetical protein
MKVKKKLGRPRSGIDIFSRHVTLDRPAMEEAHRREPGMTDSELLRRIVREWLDFGKKGGSRR